MPGQQIAELASFGADVVHFDVVNGHIAIVTPNRPKAWNVPNRELALEIARLVASIETDDAIGVTGLATSNARVFCAHADFGEIAADRSYGLMTPKEGFAALGHAPRCKPWIAEVQGMALAGGCELALDCDMIVATDYFRFEWSVAFTLAQAAFSACLAIYRKNLALELIATGDPMGAEPACGVGLVDRIAPLAQIRMPHCH